jgi:molybdopterin-guanine dinucleotide biosynthesis protein A
MDLKPKKNSLYGLVLAGGKSSRMKKDKSALDIHGKSQIAFAYELLTPYCDQVFISIRKDQSQSELFKNYLQLYDTDPFLNMGPLGGILSAMTQHPEADWLVLACDLPYVTSKTIKYLIEHRKTDKVATAYISEEDDLPEPLCAIYEAHSLDQLLDYRKNNHSCPRKFMINSDVALVKQPEKHSLINVNNPDDYRKAKSFFKNLK